jgi:hypothetical protein
MSREHAERRTALLAEHFFSRTDVVAILADWGKPTPAEPLSGLPAMLRAHVDPDAPPAKLRFENRRSQGAMAGRYRVGSYTPDPQGRTRWLCLDFDGAGHADALADPGVAAVGTLRDARAAGLPAYLERSGGGNGWHVWVLFAEGLSAGDARELGLLLAPREAPLVRGGTADPAAGRGIEVFPKQAVHRRKGPKKYGNLVWLPWWSGAAPGGNAFYEPRDAPGGGWTLEPFEPERFDTATADQVSAALERLKAARATETPSPTEAGHTACPSPGAAECDPGLAAELAALDSLDTLCAARPDWKVWRQRALAALPLDAVYGTWLTGEVTGPGWLGCRDPDSPTGDRSPSAGVADGTGEAERGRFKSFRSGEVLTVFDFLVRRGQASTFRDAVALVARLSGVAVPRAAAAPPAPPSTPSPPRPPARPRLPDVQVNNRQLRDIIGDAWHAAHAANAGPTLFRRGGLLARLKTEAQDDGANVVVVDSMSDTAVYGLLARVANWVRVTTDGRFDVSPVKDVARDMNNLPDAALPALDGVATAPYFGRDGTLVDAPGYHAGERMWLDPAPDLDVPPVPEQPSPEDIARARALLLEELLGDFPFATAADRAHMVAAILLPFVRRMVRGCTPLHVVEAPSVGSGKGLLTNVIATIATGEACDGQTLPGIEDEVRKTLTAQLLKGRPLILLDNTRERQVLDSAALASALTSRRWTDRILGESRTVSLPNRAVWLMTGNNPRLSMELARRAVRIRIDPRTDRPWLRQTFRHPDLVGWVRQNRSALVHAALVLVRAWLAAGCPAGPLRLGSFEEWSTVLGGILKTAGIDGFLGNLAELYETADAEGQAWREFTAAWWDAFRDSPKKVSELHGLCEQRDLMGSVRGDRGERSQQTRLASALQSARDRMFGDLRVVVQRNGKHHGCLYALVRVSPGPQPPPPVEPSNPPGGPAPMGTSGPEWEPRWEPQDEGSHDQLSDSAAESEAMGTYGNLFPIPYARDPAHARDRVIAPAHACTEGAERFPQVPMPSVTTCSHNGSSMGTLAREVPRVPTEVPIAARAAPARGFDLARDLGELDEEDDP